MIIQHVIQKNAFITFNYLYNIPDYTVLAARKTHLYFVRSRRIPELSRGLSIGFINPPQQAVSGIFLI